MLGVGSRVYGFESRAQGLGCQVWGWGFRVTPNLLAPRFRVEGVRL